MDYIYLSPHLDDAVYSCGGHIWQQQREGHEVEIWTICAGDPKGGLTPFASELHQRWGTGMDAVQQRREEDAAACAILGVRYRHFTVPDCIYRRIPATGEPVISVNDDLFKPVRKGEFPLVQQVAGNLLEADPGRALMYCPLSMGGHVDHRLTRMAAENTGLPLAYYADYPYSAGKKTPADFFLPQGSQQVRFELNAEALDRWMKAILAYGSQLSSFWTSESQMAEDLSAYALSAAGSSYWLKSAYSQIQ